MNYIRFNREKWLTIEVWFWAAVFRFIVLFIPAKYIRKHYGISGEESPSTVSKENYVKARLIAYHVNRIAEHTPWQSKCLVRALTAQKLLTKNKISTTLYLGIKRSGEDLFAHAWIRTGGCFVTGGTGDDYVVVAKFRK
jgi:hypothetical protein